MDGRRDRAIQRASPDGNASSARLRPSALHNRPARGRAAARTTTRPDERIRFRRAKNEHRNPIDIDIPLHPDLDAGITASKIGNLTFLITECGNPFTANGFGDRFKDWCRQANLPHCSAHGVRKATPTALAEAGATPHEIMVVTGHQTLEEVERYTKAVNRQRTADSAMAKLK